MNRGNLFALALLAAISVNVSANEPAPLELDCVIEPDQVVEVSSPIGGVIRQIDIDKSDVVEKDQVDSAQARADMRGELQSKRASLAFAKRKQERMADLYKSGAVSFQEKDEADTAVQLAKLDLQKIEETQQIAELELRKAIEALNLRTIKSPLSGVVVDRHKSAGEAVGEEPILKLAAIDPLRVVVIAQAQHFGSIHKGMHAEVIPEHMPGSRYDAIVSIVDKVVDAASGTFDVRLDLPNPDYQIPGGLKCKVRFLPDPPEPIPTPAS